MISIGLHPPKSPDLNPVDFLLRDSLKDVVYKNQPTTLMELKIEILEMTVCNIDENVMKCI